MSRHVQRANVSKSTRFLGGNAHHALPRRELDFASGSAMANKTIGISDELAAHVVEVDSRTPRMRTRTPIHALNTKGTGDERITLCLLPVADGVTLARRR